ncbi:alpha/beta fold hydrolase [Kineococcus sp. SYSU DK006]|uniref:alpha/beta fold hydrolase n=1 Tax=Kineococcus sp. SYSU DK006 TaxID=3383127 RepID=UPI003D7C3D9E
MRTLRVPVAGGVLAATVADRDAATVLLLPGQSLGPDVFDGVLADLAGDFRVVVAHTRGTGEADVAPGDWTTRTFAADALAVLDALGVARAHVYGFSMGGRVAQVLAAEHAERVGSLVLGATGPGGAHEVPRTGEVTRALRHTGSPAGLTALAELFFTPGWIAAHPATAARFAPRGTPRARRAHHAASTGHDGWDLLPRIAAPTLVLHGEDDALTPVANAALLAGRVPGARLRTFPGARHGYLEQERPQSSEVVRAFLSGRCAAPAAGSAP